MNTHRRAGTVTTVAAICAFSSGLAHAQFRTSVQGTVVDPEGAVIPNATLTLVDTANNQTITRQTDASGVFNFNALPSDKFTLTVTSPGFLKKTLTDLQFIPEQANSLTVHLDLGQATQEVTVSASTVPNLDTETSNIGVTVDSNQISHLPSFNRDVFQLSQLAPGAVSDGSQAAGGGSYNLPGNQGPGGSGNSGAFPTENGPQVESNGQAYGNNGITVDGISTVSAVWGGTTVITPSEDSIDNVRIVTNDYDAENGRFAGAQTVITSKSGTNQIHGSAYIAIHRPGLNAYNRLTKPGQSVVRDTQRYNQYGGSLGGPIWKNHVFGFFAYESSPNNSTSTGSGWYETAALKSQAPANSIAAQYLNFTGSAPAGTLISPQPTCTDVGLAEGVNCRTIAGQGLDIGSRVTTGLGKQDLSSGATANNPGVGNGLDGVADVAFYNTTTPRSSTYKQYNGRLDADVTSKDHLAFAIYWVPQTTTSYNGGARAYNLFHHDQINEAMSVIYNHTFSPTLLNEARVNVAGWHWNELTSNPQEPIGLPTANITFFGPASGATINHFGTSIGSHLNQWTYAGKDIATKVLGRHTLKFGGEYTHLEYLNAPTGRPTFGFYNIWDFLNDAPWQETGGFNSVTGLPGGNRSDEREDLWGGFVQDDWKVSPALTLHAGLRYSYFGALSAKQNNIPSVHLGAGSAAFTSMVITTGHDIYNPQKGNFGPQFGFNWSPAMFNNKLVVRGGYGLNFNQEEIAITANVGNNPPTQNNVNYQFTSPSNPGTNGGEIIYGISSSPTSLSGFPKNPNAITSYNANGLPTAGSATIVVVGDGYGNVPTIYVQHYSLDTQYELPWQLVASVGYQGSVSRHLIDHLTPNSYAVVHGYALNPLIPGGGGDFWLNEGSANNNAFLAELKHNFAHQFSFDAQFMWAKSMDTDGSGPYYEDPYYPASPIYSYGPSEFNVGKSFKLFGLWQPVIFHGDKQWLDKIVGGWSISGIMDFHTGFPYSPTYGISQSLYCQGCGYQNLRPFYTTKGGNNLTNSAFINGTNFAGITSVQNKSSKTINNSNTVYAYSNKYFTVPDFTNAITWSSATGFPAANVALPAAPGLGRNAFVGPHYRDVDASISKGFGIPNTRVLGENAKLEIRADFFNIFNILNLNPSNVTSDITSTNFGSDFVALGGRTIDFQARFSF